MNQQNLRPPFSPEEARENGRKGAAASAAVRRKKRPMREMAEMVLASPVPVSKKLEAELIKLGFEVNDANIQLMSLLSIAKKATKGDLQALMLLRDTAGEKPIDKVDMTQTVSGDFVLQIGGDDDAADPAG